MNFVLNEIYQNKDYWTKKSVCVCECKKVYCVWRDWVHPAIFVARSVWPHMSHYHLKLKFCKFWGPFRKKKKKMGYNRKKTGHGNIYLLYIYAIIYAYRYFSDFRLGAEICVGLFCNFSDVFITINWCGNFCKGPTRENKTENNHVYSIHLFIYLFYISL